jgi:hypothetical protein
MKWGLCWIYWFAHWFFVNYEGFKHFCWDPWFLLHDLEKPIKLTFGVPYSKVKAAHKFRRHHLNDKKPIGQWRIPEALCDWEASHFTKPDGPLLAKETGYEYANQYMDILIPYMKEFGFWH